jgi:ATP-dependent RNA helicase RhlE
MYQGKSRFNRGRRTYNNADYKRFSPRGGAHDSKLRGADVNIFIRKATNDNIVEEVTVTKQFSDFDLVTPLVANIANKGYEVPTPIQSQAIQPILDGRDLIGLASTGTGKTGAFLIPIINKIFKEKKHKAIIIVPTRELAAQIIDEFKSLSFNMRLFSALVIGGANIRRQIQDVRRDPDIIVATPGRLKDLIEHRALYLNDFDLFVLDEVDLMVDIGFIEDVKYFTSLLPKARQSLLFSATISPKVQSIVQSFVQNPVTVSLKKQDTSENVNQDIVKVIPSKKVDQLHDLLIQDGFDKVLIFGKTKHGIDKLSKELHFRGFKVGSIHGNKSQNARQKMLQSFKREEIQILLATDVASRGLDIPDVTHVINYDLPQTYEDYIHRIGRTGRAGKTGTALTFVD